MNEVWMRSRSLAFFFLPPYCAIWANESAGRPVLEFAVNRN